MKTEREKDIDTLLHYIKAKFKQWEEEDAERQAYLDMVTEWKMEEEKIAKWEAQNAKV